MPHAAKHPIAVIHHVAEERQRAAAVAETAKAPGQRRLEEPGIQRADLTRRRRHRRPERCGRTRSENRGPFQRTVRHQIAHPDWLGESFVWNLKIHRQISVDRRIEVDRACLHCLHGGDPCECLGDRSDAKQSRCRIDRACRSEVCETVALCQNHAAGLNDGHRRPGDVRLVHPRAHDAVDEGFELGRWYRVARCQSRGEWTRCLDVGGWACRRNRRGLSAG